MPSFLAMSKEELKKQKLELNYLYESIKEKNLKLDMSRGKPGADQLNLSMELLDTLNSSNTCKDKNNFDLRNYGIPDGTAESRELFASILEVAPENVIVGGNSSLNMMFDTVAQLMTHGINGCTPWAKLPKVKFLCPSPGYDRHFAICDYFNIEMIAVKMTQTGPDMNEISRLVSEDDTIKGIWCVPKYSNPDGVTYSNETVKKFAALKPKAKDFRIFWDNAYAVHHLNEKGDVLLNIIEQCKLNHNDDMPFVFTSTSKITFPGAGLATVATGSANIKWLKSRISMQTIGPDKLNQLRHTEMFKNADDIANHMKKHAEILNPKFEAVLSALNEIKDLCKWNVPNGGYFVSVNTYDFCAKTVVDLCKQAGVTLTPAGATFPYGKDPKDQNIRIAPTFPPISELKEAMELFCLCVKIATVEKLLNKVSY